MMKAMGKSIWTCGKCEAKDADMRAVLDSMKSIKTDLSAITKRQTAQEKGQEKSKGKAGEKKVKRLGENQGQNWESLVHSDYIF